jgi:hypothetical protein
MGDKAKGKDRGHAKKLAKPRKGGLRPHEQRQQDAATNRMGLYGAVGTRL